jgi:signal transduction histidine kinase
LNQPIFKVWNSSDKEEIVKSLIPEISTLTELADHLTGILTGVSKDIDRGLSITNQIAEIYEPFFSTKPCTGTGLGLGVVKRLVNLYGGQIRVESKENEGTIFTITLPSDILATDS